MKTRVLLLAGLLCALGAPAQGSTRELWTWTDANGVTHFSDRPVPGARRIELTGVSAPASAAGTTAPTPASSAASQSAASAVEAPVVYRTLEFVQPAQDESFFGADATVNVTISMEPELAAGHRLVLYLDGQLVEGAGNSVEHTLSQLPRGAHTLTAVILDERGRELRRSSPRVFHVRQPTVNQPAAVGPNVRPRPLPAPASRPNTPN